MMAIFCTKRAGFGREQAYFNNSMIADLNDSFADEVS